MKMAAGLCSWLGIGRGKLSWKGDDKWWNRKMMMKNRRHGGGVKINRGKRRRGSGINKNENNDVIIDNENNHNQYRDKSGSNNNQQLNQSSSAFIIPIIIYTLWLKNAGVATSSIMAWHRGVSKTSKALLARAGGINRLGALHQCARKTKRAAVNGKCHVINRRKIKQDRTMAK